MSWHPICILGMKTTEREGEYGGVRGTDEREKRKRKSLRMMGGGMTG